MAASREFLAQQSNVLSSRPVSRREMLGWLVGGAFTLSGGATLAALSGPGIPGFNDPSLSSKSSNSSEPGVHTIISSTSSDVAPSTPKQPVIPASLPAAAKSEAASTQAQTVFNASVRPAASEQPAPPAQSVVPKPPAAFAVRSVAEPPPSSNAVVKPAAKPAVPATNPAPQSPRPPAPAPAASPATQENKKIVLESRLLPDPPLQNYRQNFQLSCEVAALKIALSYWQNGLIGINESEEAMQTLLGSNEDPDLGFRGDYHSLPNGLKNYGAHAPAVGELVRNFPKPGMFRSEALKNIDDVKNALRQNKPALLWVTFGLAPSRRETVLLSNGQRKTLIPNEHVIVATGFAEGKIRIVDPYLTAKDNRTGFTPELQLAQLMSLYDQPALAISPTA